MKKKQIVPFRDEKAKNDAALEAAIRSMRALPTASLLQTIEIILGVLKERGQEVRDFDHKEKVIEQVRMIGMKPYMLAAASEEDAKEYLSELQHAKANIRELSKIVCRLKEENNRLKGGKVNGERRER